MNQEDGHKPPLVDESVLARLRSETDNDDSVWKVFVRDFITHMPLRIGKLRAALTSGDVKGAMDAVLSLRTSAQMVGALQLAGLTLELEQALRRVSRDPDAPGILPGLAAQHQRRILYCAQRTSHQLEILIK